MVHALTAGRPRPTLSPGSGWAQDGLNNDSDACHARVRGGAVPGKVSDRAGRAGPAQATYGVVYATGGTCLGSPSHQILQPVNANWQTDLSVFKQGSTIPAKFRVCDANGLSIGTAGLVTKFALVQKLSLAANEVVDEAVYSTTPDSRSAGAPRIRRRGTSFR